MSAHDPTQMTGDPNWCAERYENPTVCKASNCTCASDILVVAHKCATCDSMVHYGWMSKHCKNCQSQGLFA